MPLVENDTVDDKSFFDFVELLRGQSENGFALPRQTAAALHFVEPFFQFRSVAIAELAARGDQRTAAIELCGHDVTCRRAPPLALHPHGSPF